MLAGFAAAAVAADALMPVPAAHAAVVTNCIPGDPTAEDVAFARQVNPILTGTLAGHFDAARASCVRMIVNAVKSRDLPVQAASLAITTAIVESTIRNLDYGDRDSLGLYQQRPSQGWGTAAQILDPVHATNSFLNKMVKYPNGTAGSAWKTAPMGDVCQFVQVSAFPGRYGEQAEDGVRIAEAAWNGFKLPIQVALPGGRSFAGNGQHHVFERGANNSLQHYRYIEGVAGWNVAAVPGSVTSDPVSYLVGGQEHVYARNGAGALQHWWYDSGWKTAVLGGSIAGSPTAYYAAGQHHVYARSGAGTLYHWWFGDDGWQSTSMGGAITDSPTAYYAAGQHHVYARSGAGTLYHWWYTADDGWSSSSMGGAIAGSPTAYYAKDQHHVYVRSAAGTLYHWWYPAGGGWHAASMGGAITGTPTAYHAGGQHHVYARTSGATLNHWWYLNDDGWQTANLGGAL